MHRSLGSLLALVAVVGCGSPAPPASLPRHAPPSPAAQPAASVTPSSSSPAPAPAAAAFAWSEPPTTFRWEGIELSTHGTPGYGNDVITHLHYAEGIVAAIEAELVTGLQALGWTIIHRHAGLTEDDRQILADPEIDEEVKAVWNVSDKVELTFRQDADELTLWVEPDRRAKYEARLMLLRDVDAIRAELEAVQPCLRARLCCRAAATSLGTSCDFSDGKTLVDPADCEHQRAAYAAALEQAGHEVPPQCTAE